jgi:hypothetical protein
VTGKVEKCVKRLCLYLALSSTYIIIIIIANITQSHETGACLWAEITYMFGTSNLISRSSQTLLPLLLLLLFAIV